MSARHYNGFRKLRPTEKWAWSGDCPPGYRPLLVGELMPEHFKIHTGMLEPCRCGSEGEPVVDTEGPHDRIVTPHPLPA